MNDALSGAAGSYRRQAWLVVVVLSLGFIAYGSAITPSLLSDDFVLVERVLADGPFGNWTTTGSLFFRPLISLSLFVDASLWGMDARGYHVTNIAVHCFSSIWLFLLASSIGRWIGLEDEERVAISGLAALIFLLHPSHTEAVSWVSGRCDLLATFFVLGSFTCYWWWRDQGSRGLPWLSFLLFGGALASKESAACLPFLIAAAEALRWWRKPGRDATRALFFNTGLYFGLLALYVVVRRLAIGNWIGGYGADTHFRLHEFADRLFVFVARSLLPPLPDKTTLLGIAGAAVGLLVVATGVRRAAAGTWSKATLLAGAATVFLACSLLPVLGLRVAVDSTAGERFVYLPSAFGVLAFCSVLRVAVPSRAGWTALGVILCCASVLGLVRSNSTWNRASAMALEIVRGLEDAGPGPIYLLNLPATVDGVYVYQQGLDIALRRAYSPAPRPLVVERFAFRDPDARFEAERNGHVISVMARGANRVAWPSWHKRSFQIEYLEHSRHGFRARLPDLSPDARLFVFSGGSLVEMTGDVFPQ